MSRADDTPLLVVFGTNDTDTRLVQDVLSAAGVNTVQAPKGDDAKQTAQLLLTAVQQGSTGTSAHAGSVLTHSLHGTLQDLQAVCQVLPAARIVQVVRDVRQPVFEALTKSEDGRALAAGWAAQNAAVKDWATTQALGLARRYSIARVEDLCSSGGRPAAVKALLHNAQLDASDATVSSAAAAVRDCPPLNWLAQSQQQSAAGVLDALRAVEPGIRDALAAFGYQPLTGLGLPAWLEATAALAEAREVSQALAAAAAAADHAQAPAVVTFVSNGYEPILNNWLSWLKHSGADASRVVVVTPRGHDSAVRSRLLYRGVHVVAVDEMEPDQWEPGSSYELGAKKDPSRHARARVWLQRIRVLYEFIAAGVSVVMSDLDAIWVQNAVADLLHKADGQERGFDLMMSPGYFPFDVHKQMGVVGCMGFLYANATSATAALLGTMLREKLHQLQLREVKFFNDQRILNEQLLRANIALNNSALPQPRPQGNPEPVLGQQLTTAPNALRVLFLSDVQYARVCSNSTAYSSAVVVHCQSHNSGAAKRAFLHRVGLWRDDASEQAVQV